MKKFIPFIIIFLLMFSFFAIPVHADDDETPIPRECGICGATHDMAKMPFASRIAFEWNEAVFGGQLVDDSNSETSTFAILKFDKNGGVFSTIWSKAVGIYDYMKVIGILLCVVYASIEVSNSLVSISVSPEVLFKFLVKYLLGILLINNLFTIIELLMGMATLIFSTVNSFTNINLQFSDLCVYDEYICHDMFDGFIEMAILFLPWLIICLTKFVITIIAWYRVLDVTVRVMFAPVGAPDVLMSGTRGSGWRYLKGLFASLIQGSVIIGIFYVYSMVMNSVMVSNGLATWLMATVLSVVVMMSMLKAQEIARSIIN